MSATYVTNGVTTLIEEKEPRSSFDERVGWMTTRIFKGRHQEVRDAQVAYAGAGVVGARVTPVDDLWSELEVDFRSQLDGAGNPIGNPNDQIQLTWDLKPTIFSKDAWLAPEIQFQLLKLVPLGLEATTDLTRRIKFLMDALLRGDTAVPVEYFNANIPDAGVELSGNTKAVSLKNFLKFLNDSTSPPEGIPSSIGMDLGTWQAFIMALARGATSYQISSYVLSKHQIAPSAATVKTGTLNVNRFYTLASLLAEEPTITTAARITMPDDGFWWKQPPTLTNQPNGTYVMEQEWWWVEQFEALYYDPPI